MQGSDAENQCNQMNAIQYNAMQDSAVQRMM